MHFQKKGGAVEWKRVARVVNGKEIALARNGAAISHRKIMTTGLQNAKSEEALSGSAMNGKSIRTILSTVIIFFDILI